MGCGSIPDPFSTLSMPFNPLPHEHWIVGLAWAWAFTAQVALKQNLKNSLCRRWDLNPHALAGNGF